MEVFEKIGKILREGKNANGKFALKNKIIKHKIVDEAIIQRHSEKYKQWRKAIFIRDKATCQKCGKRGGRINAHHILGFKKHKKWRFEMRNSITLCAKCHRKFHDIYGKKNFPNIIKVWNIDNSNNKYLEL